MICVTYVQKQLLKKYQIFMKLTQFHIFKKFIISLCIIGKRKTNCFYPFKFIAGTCKESTFSFLPVVNCIAVVILTD